MRNSYSKEQQFGRWVGDGSAAHSQESRNAKKWLLSQTEQNKAKSLIPEPLVAIFGIYTKFASQRTGLCLKKTFLDLVRGHNVSRKKAGNTKPFKTEGNPWFLRLSWPFSESTRNLLHNAMVVVSNGRF